MHLTDDEVKKIARLAKLTLSDDEVKKFGGQLSGLLEQAKMLEEIDTSDVEPIAQITGLNNVSFGDVEVPFSKPERLLSQSPQSIVDNMIRVKNVF